MIFLSICIMLGLLSAPAAGLNGSGDNITSNAIPQNVDIVVDETIRMILEMQDHEGHLRTKDNRIVEQPIYLQMDVPASVREKIVSRLIENEVRMAAAPEGYHALHIEWEADNKLVIQSGNRSIRMMQSQVIFSWFDADREIQNTWNDSFVREDRIPTENVEELNSFWQPASFHTQESSRRLSIIRRVAEPALITGAVAVTVYLLYNVRR